MGDLEGAAEAFERAYELRDDGQPGMALLHLARGEIEEAARSIERALAATATGEGPVGQATRGRLLPAAIDIALAAGDLDAARTRSKSWSRSRPGTSDPCSRRAP